MASMFNPSGAIHPSLSAMRPGQRGIVRSLTGTRAFCSRVANLGFTAGAQVEVVQNYGRGPIIVAVRGTRVALGRAEADLVQVEALLPGGLAGGAVV